MDGSWITYLIFEPKHKRFYIAAGTQIFVYSANRQFLHKMTSPSPRQIVCLEYHPELQYLFAGIHDGSSMFLHIFLTFELKHLYLASVRTPLMNPIRARLVQVWNLNNTLIHEFTGHFKPVTAIKYYNKTLIMSSSQDGNVRLWDVSTFRMVYRLHVKDELNTMGVLDPSQIWTSSSNGLASWGVNIVNQTFAHVKYVIQILRWLPFYFFEING
jgi:WD40 repeat protein